MERVVNSVNQILNECSTMLEKVENCEYVDVSGLAKSLRDECKSLKEIFDNTPDKESEIKIKKQTVERLAIKLEFYMSVRMNMYNDRRSLRNYAATMYSDCRNLTLAINGKPGISSEELVYWGSMTNWALKFYSRSMHVIFETDEDDEKHIKDIIDNMKIMKERVNYG